MKILLVEDSDVSRFLLENLLRKQGYEVRATGNGQEALEVLAAELVDLIISDTLMPKMDGFELCRAVKTNPRTNAIPFVFYSAEYITPEDEQFALKLGAIRYIVKTEDLEAFVRVLEEVLARPGEDGTAGPATPPSAEQYWPGYADRLVHKLEEKVAALEQANDQLLDSNFQLRKVNTLLEAQVAEFRRVEEKLRQAEERYRTLFQQSVEAIFLFDPLSKNLLEANPAFLHWLGYTAGEAAGLSIYDFMDQDRVAIDRDVERILQSGGTILGERVWRRRMGTPIEVQMTASRIRQGVSDICFVVARDVTERHRIEEQLRQAQKMEVVERLSGWIAHDYNNLLTVILGYSDQVLLHLLPDDPLRQKVESIQKAGTRAASLTDQLLAISRRQVLKPQELDLNALIVDLSGMLRSLMGASIDLVTILGPDLGCVRADPDQIRQVVLELAENARDSMPQGGKLTIETANLDLDENQARRHGRAQPLSCVLLTVSDSGLGMDPETLSHVFEPFFTTKEVGQGQGLGLSAVYGIVKQSEGHIEVHSAPERGTTFKIFLPLVEKTVKPGPAPPVSATAPPGGRTVLLVDDDELIRTLFAEVLQGEGYTVLVAGGGAEAIALGQRHREPIHLLLTDVVMPFVGGKEVAQRLIDSHPDLKVIFMSGYTGDILDRQGALEPGTLLLQKPFSVDVLLRRIREVLEQGP